MRRAADGVKSFLAQIGANIVAYYVVVLLATVGSLFIPQARHWLVSTIHVRAWMLCGLAFIAVSCALPLIVGFVRTRQQRAAVSAGQAPAGKPEPPTAEGRSRHEQQHTQAKWSKYKHDRFIGLDWYWSYDMDSIREYTMVCQKCKGTVRLERKMTDDGMGYYMILRCQACNLEVDPPSTDITDWLSDTVSRTIRQNGWAGAGFNLRSPT